MKSIMIKNCLREIRDSLGRYMAILAIVALGVGFFAGLKVTKPTMIESGTDYLNGQNLYDFRLLSTVGFDEKSVAEFTSKPGVKAAEGGVNTDFLAEDENGQESALTAYSMLKVQNQLVVKEGRLPRSGQECVVDSNAYPESAIGSLIRVSQSNDTDTLEMLKYAEYTITGICEAPAFTNFERGTTSLGNGKLSGFIYIPEEGFDSDYYTEMYVRMDEDYTLYSQEYKDCVAEWKLWVEPLCDQVAYDRYTRLREDALWEIENGEKELKEQTGKAQKKLDDARQELQDAEEKIADSEEEIADGRKKIADAWKEITDKTVELTDSQTELADAQAEIDDGYSQIADKRAEQADMTPDEADALNTGLKLKEAQLKGAEAQLQSGIAQIDMGQGLIASARKELAQKEEDLKKAEEKLADAREELKDGWEEYDDGVLELAEETADAQRKLEDGRRDLADLKEPDIYTLGRDKNIGYAMYENDAAIVEGIANVFPIFFFLVAALVCITTMARMVEEQRTQIGVLKALGYSGTAVIGKYLFYSGSAAILGCIVGLAVGTVVFPEVIWYAYGMLYHMGRAKLVFDWWLAVWLLAISCLCSMGITFLVCRYELISVAAELMRPKAPKNGRRIILEKIPFLWKRMKFLVKVSARNIFRYKQRFYMMVFGIGGCTALLVTGFGVKDSIVNITGKQYGEIQTYDMSVVFTDPYIKGADAGLDQVFTDHFAYVTPVHETTVDLTANGVTKSVTLSAVEDSENIDKYVTLRTIEGEVISYPSEGEAVISAKVADKCSLGIGDSFTLENSDMRKLALTVSGICENYIYNYVYILPSTWNSQMGSGPEFKTAYLKVMEGEDVHSAAAALMKEDNVASVSVNEDMQIRITGMMQSMNAIVLLIIVCAGSLAFIVLYNLTNINITERLREIATIKVLGFYPGETAQYVFRENMVLTAVGAVVGLFLGSALHRFVMYRIDIDMISFDIRIRPLSIVLSVVLTFVFAIIVDLVMYRKLEHINMAESMKSIE